MFTTVHNHLRKMNHIFDRGGRRNKFLHNFKTNWHLLKRSVLIKNILWPPNSEYNNLNVKFLDFDKKINLFFELSYLENILIFLIKIGYVSLKNLQS